MARRTVFIAAGLAVVVGAGAFVGVGTLFADGDVRPEPRPTAPKAGSVSSRLGDFISFRDHNGDVVGYLPYEQTRAAEGSPRTTTDGYTWVDPPHGVPAHDIREAAQVPLIRVWPRVLEWWNDRPLATSSDRSFLIWWASYPIEGRNRRMK